MRRFTMAVTPGAAGKLNTIKGISKIITTTFTEELALADKVFPSGLIFKKDDGKIYITDGTTKLSELAPRVDQIVDAAEKTALSSAFSTGSYVAAPNGVVVHDASGKIDDGSLNLVNDGKLVESYLSKYIENGMIKLEVLPDTVRASINYVATYADLANLNDEQKKALAFVIDATGDPSGNVKSGAAMYIFQSSDSTWLKIAEHESLDINVGAIECNYANMQAAGGVMYDHELDIGITATELAALVP